MDELIYTKLTIQGVTGAVIVNGTLKTCKSAPVFLSIPRECTALGDSCLSGQDDLEVLRLHSTITSVGKCVLSNCNNLKTIKCSEKLKKFESLLKYGNNAEVVYVHSNKQA
jgi:hypothetical protein